MLSQPYRQFFIGAAAVAATIGILSANPITLVTPNGGKVQIAVTYNDGSTALSKAGLDNGAFDEDPTPGKFKFTPPNQKNVRTIEIKNLGAAGVAAAVIDWIDFGPGGMDAFPPLTFPEYAGTDTSIILLTQINVPTFSGTFTPGDTVPSTGGSVPGLTGVTVRNVGGSYASFFDVFVELSLPDVESFTPYTGNALTLDAVETLPEPGTLAISGVALAGLALLRRRMRASR